MKRVHFVVLLIFGLFGGIELAAQTNTYTQLADFSLIGGSSPRGGLSQGRDGNIYVTTDSGGGSSGSGALFQMTTTGSSAFVHAFQGLNDGCYPKGGVSLGSDGFLYGTAEACGASSNGTLFKTDTLGKNFSVLHAFSGGTDGGCPLTAPTLGSDGSFYGTSRACVSLNAYAYKLTKSGSFQVLSSFVSPGEVDQDLLLGTDGSLWGVSRDNGANTCGSVFRMSTSGSTKVTYTFDGHGGSGCYPSGPLVQGADGSFYGVTFAGGNGYGTVFRITSAGKLTLLHQFSGTDGQAPFGQPLVPANDGNFYGTASAGGTFGFGLIYKISSTGSFNVLYQFDGTSGTAPTSLLQSTNGKFYGVTTSGGSGSGVFYSFDTGLPAFISLVSGTAKVGQTVEILGQGFTGATKVSFGGTSGSFTVVSDTYLTALVPNGAQTGSVAVTAPSGILNSNRAFLVAPQLKSFSPSSGAVGTAVTITGVSLTQATRVTFGGVKATSFTVNSDTQITATVPTTAKSGKVGVVTAGGSAYSTSSFTVTP